MKNILVMFGGESAEHEVSIISGLQVLEQMDTNEYNPLALYVTKSGEFKFFGEMTSRTQFNRREGKNVEFGRDEKGSYVKSGLIGGKTYVNAAYLAFHGGTGEDGTIQGFLRSWHIPFTSASHEAMAVAMNKALTREVLMAQELPVTKGLHLLSLDMRSNITGAVSKIEEELGLPVIIKPAHLGSSIGIEVAKTTGELHTYLSAASLLDTEIVVEELLQDFTEYNCAVRLINGEYEASEVERPIGHDEILSFADKYEKGGKKSGGEGGMASLNRELPAKISEDLRAELQTLAINVFQAIRASGMIRIDFMVTTEGRIYVTEVNPIPGSMSYYLWEASGYTFTEQITDLIEEAIRKYGQSLQTKFDHQSNIVEKFVSQKKD